MFNVEQFQAWVEAQPEGKVWACKQSTCPVAEYLHEHGFKGVEVDGYDVYDPSTNMATALETWQQALILRIDRYADRMRPDGTIDRQNGFLSTTRERVLAIIKSEFRSRDV